MLSGIFYIKRKKSPVLVLLFLLWPFLALLRALKNYKKPYAKATFVLFCLFFGFSFIVPEDKVGAPDSARYAQWLVEMHKFPLSFDGIKDALYSQKSNYVDIYQPIVTWIVSLFTDNPHFLFAIFALVFGYFYANNLWLLLNRVKTRILFPLFIFMLVFALLNPIWNINGVRMYTASQIFIYGVFVYLLNGNKKGLIWALSSCIVHFSFLFPVTLLYLFLILPKKLPIFFIFFILTASISEISLLNLQNYLSFLPEIFQFRAGYYTNPDYAKSVAENIGSSTWVVTYPEYALKGVIYSLIILIFFSCRKTLKKNEELNMLFCFVLFIFGWARIAAVVPSGSRFLTIAYVLSMAFFILLFNEARLPKKVNRLKLIVLPFLLFYCIVSIRIGFEYMGISTLIGNFYSSLLINDKVPLIKLFN
jgi:hypothetical protein